MNLRKMTGASLLLLTLLLVLSPQPVRAQAKAAPGGEPFLVTTAWVAEHLQDQNLVLIEIGEKKDYQRGHIPGARFLDYHKISTSPRSGLTLELPPVQQLVTVFQELGVTDQSRIVLYFGREWVTPTARVYLTLDYLGLRDRTSMLDGGLPQWRSEGRTVTTEVPRVVTGTLTPHPRNDVVVEADFVKQNLHRAGVALVDARDEYCYSGKDNCGHPRAGHIPGALNIPSSSVMDSAGKLKTREQLREMFSQAGVKPGDQVVTYCHIGQKASLLYFLARYLGYDARMYDGSFEEWSARKDLPVEGRK
jgi:thiosulfate/3-mercaptopyruvate sulfurtransferase